MDEKLLIRSAQKGSEDAWAHLVKKYGGLIYSLCYQFTMNRADAEELMQEVFLKIYYNLNSFDLNKNFLGWAMMLTKNLCIDTYRKNRKEKNFTSNFEEALFKIPSEENLENQLINKEKYLKLMEFLHDLSEEVSSMILLKDLMGLTLEEISEIYKIPVGTVKSKLSRGRFQIALKMKEYFEGKEEKI